MNAQGVLKIDNFVPCDMSLWSNGGSTGANNPDNYSPQSLLKVLKAPQTFCYNVIHNNVNCFSFSIIVIRSNIIHACS